MLDGWGCGNKTNDVEKCKLLSVGHKVSLYWVHLIQIGAVKHNNPAVSNNFTKFSVLQINLYGPFLAVVCSAVA